MTMQSSGPISIGQACAECGFGYGVTVDAGNPTVSMLGYQPSGSLLRWSYWYGQTYLAPIQRTLMFDYSASIDIYFWMYYNFRVAGYSYSFNGENNPRLLYLNQYYGGIPLISLYTSITPSVIQTGGRNSTYITVFPSASNDYTVTIVMDDAAQPGAWIYGAACYLECHNRFG